MLKVKRVPLGSLHFDPSNARKHDDKNIGAIKGSIAKFGQVEPLVIQKGTGVVIGGNGRLAAMKAMGHTECDVVELDVNSVEASALAIALNRTGELAEWDAGVLSETLKSLQAMDFDLGAIGFDEKDLAGMIATPIAEGLTDPDSVPEDVETRCKPGDLWVLGGHVLLCGDSTNVQHVERLMGGEKADLCFTSPPYNAAKESFLNGRVGGFDKKYETHTDDLTDGDYRDLLTGFTNLALATCRFVFVNLQLLAHNRIPLVEYQYAFREQLKDILIWNKRQCPPNIVKGAFNTKWEYVFCYSHENKTRGFPCDWQGQHPNVVETESNSGNEFAAQHKAGFPVTFPLWFLDRLDFAKSVYEPFTGTGTTLIACEKTGRRCFGMEIDAHYCDVILTRWEKFTGKTAVLNTAGAELG